ncbi:major facilitator superfamily domain-containing protein [Mycena floridula]|nr:major facilitator superfamily domain-containing protein [Mycena floridula]
MAVGLQHGDNEHAGTRLRLRQILLDLPCSSGLLGIAMDGIWSLSMSNALENLPPDSRGPASGVVQQGYPLGSLLATVLNLALVSQTKVGWRALFIVAIRAFVPESRFFVDVKEREGIQPVSDWQKTCTFVKVIYGIIFNPGMTFIGHGSQDLYPTYLQTTKGLSARSSNLATIIGSCGGIAGGILSGFLSQYFGRRLTMISCSIFVLLFIPLWILPSPFHVLAFGVGLQFAVGDISGILAEISPPAFRAFFTGVVHSDDGL